MEGHLAISQSISPSKQSACCREPSQKQRQGMEDNSTLQRCAPSSILEKDASALYIFQLLCRKISLVKKLVPSSILRGGRRQEVLRPATLFSKRVENFRVLCVDFPLNLWTRCSIRCVELSLTRGAYSALGKFVHNISSPCFVMGKKRCDGNPK
jgi:hypothetical protein